MFTAQTLPDGTLKRNHYLVAPESLSPGEVVVEGFPSDEISLHFVQCWKLSGNTVVVDLALAKAQRAQFIIDLCDEGLSIIDGKTQRALREALLTGNNTRVQTLENEAIALRQVRSNTGVDSLTTIEEVAAYLPAILAD